MSDIQNINYIIIITLGLYNKLHKKKNEEEERTNERTNDDILIIIKK